MTTYIAIVTEDALSEAVLRKILRSCTKDYEVHNSFGSSGFGFIKTNIPRFINASNAIPHIVLTDLDKGECAPSLISEWFKTHQAHKNLIFRVAVRETESWLMADRHSFSIFSGVPISKIPTTPDDILDPKQTLINLFRSSRKTKLANEIIPPRMAIASIGPGYNEHLCKYVESSWDPNIAATNSPSLSRTISRINAFTPTP